MTDDLRDDFLKLFNLVNTNYGYNNIILSNKEGIYLAGTRPGEKYLDTETARLIKKAIEDSSHLFTHIYYCSYHDELHYDLIVPVWNNQPEPLAIVIFRNDPEDYLFKLVNEWPNPSPTAESLIAYVEGDEVVMINSPRLSDEKPLAIRLNLRDTMAPVVKAAAGYIGFTHGKDYLGKQVVSYVMPISDTPWFLTVKMDKSELFKEITDSTIAIVSFALLLIFLLASALVAIYSFRQRSYYKHILLKEKALEQSEHNYREVFNSTSEAIFVDEAETGSIIDVNDAMLRMYGYSNKAEVIKGNIGDLSANVSPYTQDVAQQYIMMARNEGPQTFEWLAKRKSGENFWAEVTLRRATIGGADRILAVVREITDRKKLELDLRQTEEMLRNVLNTIPVRVFWKSRDLTYLGCNEPFVKDAGKQSFNEVIGKTDFDMGWHEVAELYRADDKAVIENGQPKLNFEEPQTNAEGREMWLKTSKIPLRDGHGEIIGVLGVYEDITEKKKSELELIEKQQALEAQNEEYYAQEYLRLNEELKTTNENLLVAVEKAQESERLKTAFLNNLSHEIRTPLNAIIGFSDFLDNPGLDAGEQKKFVQVIQRNGFQLAGIINDIVSIATIEAGQEKLREGEASLIEIMETVVQQFENKAKTKNLELSFACDLDAEQAMVLTDETKLTQMLGNLVNNALKFTDKGAITIGCKPQGDMLHFSVTDTGIGIDPKYHESIFERFRQVEPSPEKFYGGNGLGLAITKAYTELMGGSIWLESAPDKGSTFHFTIAYQPTKTQINQAMEKSVVPGKSGRKTILVVEDEHSNYFFLEIMFKKMNIEPIIALNGQEAIDFCKEKPEIDLVLMDLKMPVLDGFEATRVIKAMRPDLPIIAQTAYALSADKHRAIEAGCEDYLTKPIRKQDLLAVLAKYL